MQLEQQSHRLPGHVLALVLAMAAAVLLAGSLGYALRAAGFPGVSGWVTKSPATATVEHAQAPDAQDRNSALRGTPVYNDQVVPELPAVTQTWGAVEAPQANSAQPLEGGSVDTGRTVDSDRLTAQCRRASGPTC